MTGRKIGGMHGADRLYYLDQCGSSTVCLTSLSSLLPWSSFAPDFEVVMPMSPFLSLHLTFRPHPPLIVLLLVSLAFCQSLLQPLQVCRHPPPAELPSQSGYLLPTSDSLCIALRKCKRTCTSHPISQFVPWVYTVKYLPDSSVECLKARLVARGKELEGEEYIMQLPGFVAQGELGKVGDVLDKTGGQVITMNGAHSSPTPISSKPTSTAPNSSACQSHGAHSSPTPISSKPTSTAPKPVPEETFADLGNNESSLIISTNDEFRWFSDMETTSSTVLESPIFAERRCLKISMKRPGREG
uniref:Uncharacterized protein n=2 Tax=Fagus sylvatica TaxID=28930 RepID=A0A2N9H6D0_FAGSY